MKKLSVLILSFVLIFSVSFSQSIKVVYNGIQLSNNAIIDTFNTPSTLFSIPLGLKNISSSTAQIKLKKVINYAVSGSDVSFCFAGNCFDPTVFTSPTTATIDKDSTDMSFLSDYSSNGHTGVTSVTYLFFKINVSGDTTKVTFKFETGVGVNDISKADIYFSDAYPNPANNSTSIAYALPKATKSAAIRISNILGSKVYESAIEDLNGKKTIDLSSLTQGVYFYSLVVNDKIYYTKKLIVK